MVRRWVGIFILSVLAAVGLVASALAKGSAVQATDPSANSPAGVVYSIPLDSARQDAAPHHSSGHSGGGTGGNGSGGGSAGGGGSTGGGAGGTGGSGATGSGAGGTSGSSASGSTNSTGSAGRAGSSHRGGTSAYVGSSAPVLVPGGQPGSLIHSSNGFGSSSSVPSLSTPASAGIGAVQSNASSAPLLAILLAAVVLVLGSYVGARAWRAPRRRNLPPPRSEPPQLPAGQP